MVEPATPMAVAMELAARDVKGLGLSSDELAWLHDHPVTWVRALGTLKRQTEAHISKEKASVAAWKPTPGQRPTADYVRAKQAADQANLPRLHFRDKCVLRLAEVKSLVGFDRVHLLNDADTVEQLQSVLLMLEDGQAEKAAATLRSMLDKIT